MNMTMVLKAIADESRTGFSNVVPVADCCRYCNNDSNP